MQTFLKKLVEIRNQLPTMHKEKSPEEILSFILFAVNRCMTLLNAFVEFVAD